MKNETLLHSTRTPYLKPTMQVYEIEVEGAIMDGTSGGSVKAVYSADDDGPADYGYADSWF